MTFGEIFLEGHGDQSLAGKIAPSCPLGQPITVQNLIHLARSRSQAYNRSSYSACACCIRGDLPISLCSQLTFLICITQTCRHVYETILGGFVKTARQFLASIHPLELSHSPLGLLSNGLLSYRAPTKGCSSKHPAAFESVYCGQFTLSTQLIKTNYLEILPTDAAPQFL